jgi:hypothetical protein
VEIAVKSCKNFEILFVWPERAPQPPPCLSRLNGMGGDECSDFKNPIGRTFLSGNRIFAYIYLHPKITSGVAGYWKSCIRIENMKVYMGFLLPRAFPGTGSLTIS